MKSKKVHTSLILSSMITFIILLLAIVVGGRIHSSPDSVSMIPVVHQEIPLEREITDRDAMLKAKVISRVLRKHNSPMTEYSGAFVMTAAHYRLDHYLLPSISKLESSFGHQIMPGSHNPFGWNSGRTHWNGWGEGIFTVGRALRFRYIDRGAHSIAQIGNIYAASPTWSSRVEMFIGEFYNVELEVREQMKGLLT